MTMAGPLEAAWFGYLCLLAVLGASAVVEILNLRPGRERRAKEERS